MSRTAVLAAWAVAAALFVACEVVSIATRGRYAGMRGLLARLAGGGSGRLVVLFIGWMWIGWHFFAR